MKETIAKILLDIQAVFLRPDDPFIWSSGIKSPIYCDNRLILSEPAAREVVEKAIADTVTTTFPNTEMLMGTSTAGIAHAAITAHLLNIPTGYVRGSAKAHGRSNQIEGRLQPGQKVVVIEDLISTGGSAITTVQALRDAGAEVLGIVSIFTYGMQKSIDNMRAENINCTSLSNLDTLAQVAVENGYITERDIKKLLLFRDNPQDESWFIGE